MRHILALVIVLSLLLTLGGVCAAELTVEKVWPEKLVYYPEEDALATVTLHNPEATPAQGVLVVELVSELDRVRLLLRQEVSLQADQTLLVPVRWNTGAEEWGFEIRATLLDEGTRVLSSARDFLLVVGDIYKVSIRGHGKWPGIIRTEEEYTRVNLEEYRVKLRASALECRREYINYSEEYGWAPDDYFELYVPEDKQVWWSGTGTYIEFRQWYKDKVQEYHKHGLRVISYTNPFGMGAKSQEVLSEHPEWFAYDRWGLPLAAQLTRDLDVYNARVTHTFAEVPKTCSLHAPLNMTRLDVVERQCQEIIDAVKEFGFDGMRWDNFYHFVADDYDWQGRKMTSLGDPNEISTRNVIYVRERLKEALGPNFSLGTNMLDRNLTRLGTGWPYYYPEAWGEMCKDHFAFMSERLRHCYLEHYYPGTWPEWMHKIVEDGEWINSHGGQHIVINLDGAKTPVDQTYNQVLVLAGRAHTFGNAQFLMEGLPGFYSQFATRYAALLWDIENIIQLDQPTERLAVNGDREIWWEELAYERQPEKGPRQVIVHLVNPPPYQRIWHPEDQEMKFPEPQENVQVELKLRNGEQVTQAWLLTAEPEASAQELEVETDGETALAAVPRLTVWAIVVFETTG